MTRRPRNEDPGAGIGELYGRFAATLYRYALMILVDPFAAADVVQQVFAAMLRRSDFELAADERYLRRAVRNECFSALRRRRREPVADGTSLLQSVNGHHPPIDEQIAVEQALRSLPPDQREVVHLKIFEGLSFQEIADLSGESINTIASRYRYALDKLRAVLGGRI